MFLLKVFYIDLYNIYIILYVYYIILIYIYIYMYIIYILHIIYIYIYLRSGINETKQGELELLVSCLHNHSASL